MKAGQNLKGNRSQNPKVKGGQNLHKTAAKYVAPGSLGRRVPNRPTSFSTLTSSSDVPSQSLPMPQATPTPKREREPTTVTEGMLQREGEPPIVPDNMPQRQRELPVDRNRPLPAEQPAMEDAHVAANEESYYRVRQKNVRGISICKAVVRLRRGEKMPISFYNNHGAGPNRATWSSFIGLVVRNPQICSFKSRRWKSKSRVELEHMWAAVTEYFSNPHMIEYKYHTLIHMRDRWNKWRSVLYREYAKPCGCEEEALKNKPDTKLSKNNALNRMKKTMNHHSGSKPNREYFYEMGGKDGSPTTIDKVFFETHKSNGEIKEQAAKERHAGLVETCEANPELEPMELVEKYYGEQRHGHIIGFGGGLIPKDLKGSDALSRAELASKLRDSNGEKADLAAVIAEQAKVIYEMRDMMERMNQRSGSPTTTQNGHS